MTQFKIVSKNRVAEVQVIYRAVTNHESEPRVLGEYSTPKRAKQAIDSEEACIWNAKASNPPEKAIICHDCDGTGMYNREECNMCAGNGWIWK